MPSKKVIIVVTLSMVMVMAAGCAGWGADGPAEPQSEEDGTDDGEAQAQEETDGEDTQQSDVDAGSSSQTEQNTEAGAQSGSDPDTDSGSESNAKAEGGSADVDVHIDDSSDTNVEADSESESDVETDMSADSKSTSESESESNSDSDSVSVSESDADSEGSSDSESDASSESDADAGSDSESESGSDAPHDKSCSAFNSYDEAKSYYDEAPEDRGQLDRDNDDIPCEHLQEEPETNTLTVKVTDENGAPVDGAKVHVNEYPDGETGIATGTTDENGETQFDLVDGAYELSVGHNDYQLGQHSDNRSVGMDGKDKTYHIKMSGSVTPDAHTLTVHAGEPEPVENVAVTIKRHEDGATTEKTTGEDGTVTFDVYEGTYTVTGVDERREDQAKRVEVTGDTEVTLDRLERPVGEIKPIQFKIEDQNGNALEGMGIKATTDIPGGETHVMEAEDTHDVGRIHAQGHVGETYTIQKVYDVETGETYPVKGVVLHGQKEPESFVHERGDTAVVEIEHPGAFPDEGNESAAAA